MLDPSFNFPKSGFDATAFAVVPTCDGTGDIYVGGDFSLYGLNRSPGIARLQADAMMSSSFSVGAGITGGNRRVLALATDGTGSVYLGGSFTAYDGTPVNNIVRLNADGTLDPGFDTSVPAGSSLSPGFDGDVLAMVLADDGSGDVYVAGTFTSYRGTQINSLVRLNSDGSIDFGFDTGFPRANARVSTFDGAVRALALATDGSGSLYVGGDFSSYRGVISTSIIRLLSNGSIDFGFDTGFIEALNRARAAQGFDSGVTAIATLEDGSGDVYVGGGFSDYNGAQVNGVARLHSDGSLDPVFSAGIGSGVDNGAAVHALHVIDMGRVVMAGAFTSFNGVVTNRLVTLNPTGSVFSVFNTGTGFDSPVQALAGTLDGSGDIYSAGSFIQFNGSGARRLLRHNSDGGVDPEFPVGYGIEGSPITIEQAVDGSGDLYVGGIIQRYNGVVSNSLVRINTDGSIDREFNVGQGFNGFTLDILPVEDGSGDVYVSGVFSAYQGTPAPRIIRLNSDASIDAAFDVGAGFNSIVARIVQVPDGSGDIYAFGGFSQFNGEAVAGMIRLRADGSVNDVFDVGPMGFGFRSTNTIIAEILPAADGSQDVYVAGDFLQFNGMPAGGLVRLNADGSMDTGFDIGAGFAGAAPSSFGLVLDIAYGPSSSNDIFVAGYFDDVDGVRARSLVLLNEDGTIDGSFDLGGEFDGGIISMERARDGTNHLVAIGEFTSLNGVNAPGIVRVDMSGAIVPGFDAGTGFGGIGTRTNPLELQAVSDGTGDLYATGYFDSYNDEQVDKLVAINPDGSLD